MKSIFLSFAAVAALAVSSAAGAVSYTYAGSWAVSDGSTWGSNPLAYSGKGAAALLFGGSASQYVISTVDNNPLNINFMSNYAIIGVGYSVFADNYFRGSEGTTHYQDVYTFDAALDTVSAYVGDFSHSPRNFAFIASQVPEPASWALMLVGFGLAGTALRRQKVAVSFG